MELPVFKMKMKAFSGNWVQSGAVAKLASTAVQWAIPSRPPQNTAAFPRGKLKLPKQLHFSLKRLGSSYRSKPRIHYHNRRLLPTYRMKVGNSASYPADVGRAMVCVLKV